MDYDGQGCSVMEMSHRSSQIQAIINEAEQDLHELLKIPDSHQVIFMQSGATGQFSAVVYNLLDENGVADYLVTGGWSEKAAEEASRLGANVHFIHQPSNDGNLSPENFRFSPNASYIYYCDNETVHGIKSN